MTILGHMDEGYTKMESMLQENDNKCEMVLAKMERKLDATLEEIKFMIKGVILQNNDIIKQLNNQEKNTQRIDSGQIDGNPRFTIFC